MHMRALLGYKIPDVYTRTKGSLSKRLIKRPLSGHKYGFEFDLSESTSSKRLKASCSRAVSSHLNKSTERHILNSGDGKLPSDNIPSQSAVNDNTISSVVQQVDAPVPDAEGRSNIIDLAEPSIVSSDSSEDVIGALKGIVRAPRELIKQPTSCADPASLPTNSDTETVARGASLPDEGVQDVTARNEDLTEDVSTPVISTDSDELRNKIEALPEIGTVDTQHCIQDLAQQTANFLAAGHASNMQVVQIENIDLLKHGDTSGHVPSIQEMSTGDKSSPNDGFVPSS